MSTPTKHGTSCSGMCIGWIQQPGAGVESSAFIGPWASSATYHLSSDGSWTQS